jgi:hypothetical protein
MLAEIIWNEKTLAVAGTFAVPITAIVAAFWYKWNKTRADHELKQSMIARGMSVEEMERVMTLGRK